jgi:pimeloyl-ACP methyl ester carboxylesterase
VPNGVGFQLQSKAMLAQFSAFQQKPTAEALQSLMTGLGDLQKDAAALQESLKGFPLPPANLPNRPDTKQSRIADAIINGLERYTSITPPVLAIFAGVPNPPPTAPARAVENRAAQMKLKSQQMEAFRAAMPPTTRVVWFPEAAHAVWMTNEEDVVREMNAFLAARK